MERLSYLLLRTIRATCYGAAAGICLCAVPSNAQQPDARQLARDINEFNAQPPAPERIVYIEPAPVQWPGNGLWPLTDGARAELETLAFVLWNEAHEEGRQAIGAVASVIHNRSRQSGFSYVHTVAAPGQFSGYRETVPDDFIHPNIQALNYSGELQAWTDCHLYAERMVRGGFQYELNSDHFYSGPEPYWAKNLTNIHKIGKLTFGRMQRQN